MAVAHDGADAVRAGKFGDMGVQGSVIDRAGLVEGRQGSGPDASDACEVHAVLLSQGMLETFAERDAAIGIINPLFELAKRISRQ
jgi:hypothetical protein